MAIANGTAAIHITAAATMAAVMPTPITARASAGQTARRSIESCVLRPPSNRITASATLPTR